NDDGHPDLVVVNNLDTHTHIGTRFVTDFTTTNPGTVSVLIGNGDGTFQAPQSFGVGVSPNAVAVGDFNGDGHPDFAVSNQYNPLLALSSNTGGGNFSGSTTSLGSNNIGGNVAVGDFNGDGVADLAVPVSVTTSPSQLPSAIPEMRVFNGHAGGTLQPGATYAPSMGIPLAADLNGHGNVDLVGSGD